MTFTVEMTDRARRDAQDAYDWIAREAPAAADRWLDGLEEAVRSLDAFPQRCKRAAEAEALGVDLRQRLYGRHRILFVIDGDTVLVLHIRHGARRALGEAP